MRGLIRFVSRICVRSAWVGTPLLLTAAALLVLSPRQALTIDCPPCDDGNLCTNDTCDTGTGTCQHSNVVCPDDGNQCTFEVCQTSTGVCLPFPNSRGACDDGNACTTNDQCIGTTCYPGTTPRSCSDGNPCTADSCNSQTGCVFTPTGGGCSDANACTGGDFCAGGQCQPGAPVTCNDGNACTSDTCDTQAGCRHANAPGPCDDGSACTDQDQCVAGVCLGNGVCPCADQDGDGFADCDAVAGCDPTGLQCGDCDDTRAGSHPGASDTCNHLDDDCDGAVDEGNPRITSQQSLAQAGGEPGDRFGAALALTADLNGDGVGDLAIGVPGEDGEAGGNTGAVMLHSGADRSILCVAEDPAGYPGDFLGASLAVLEDVTGDGVPDLVAGAPGSTGPYAQGRVVIISGADCSIVRSCTDSVILTLSGGQQSQAYRGIGTAVASAGDRDGDGIDDIVAGDPGAMAGNPFVRVFNNGRAVVFSGSNCQVISRMAPVALTDDNIRFGAALANLGDLTGDGVDEIAVGALFDPFLNHYGYGEVVVYTSSPPAAPRAPMVDLSPDAFRGLLGSALAVLQDINGDGVADLAAGEPEGNANGVVDAGAVVLFSGADGALLRRCVAPDGAAGDHLGQSLAALPDIDGDGVADIAASAPQDDNDRGVDAGSILLISGADCHRIDRLTDADGVAGAFLGISSLILAGDLIGDPARDLITGSGPNSGAGHAAIFGGESDCDGDGVGPSGDCDDVDPATGPDAPEICDGMDNNCDTAIDEGPAPDGQPCPTGQPGVCAAGVTRCDGAPYACVPIEGPSVETCDGLDNDCDGAVDDVGPDTDGDGHHDACDNCPTVPNADQNICACAMCGVTGLALEKGPNGTGILIWQTNFEVNYLGFNVVTIDKRGQRIQVNGALIPCQECTSGRGAGYAVPIPKHRSGRDLYVEQISIGGTTRQFGPAERR